MVSIEDYTSEKECVYKDERYSVRDNGAVMRHAREGKRVRKEDNKWTFGKPNGKTGYMEIAGQRVHRIVAFAFHGEPPTNEHVVDHIDTNRRNNRPENLRWLTRLENALNNPITRARIENICGSIENFLANPDMLRNHEHVDKNFSWMRAVSHEEASASLKNMTEWAKNPPQSKGGTLGEWIFKEKQSTTHSEETRTYPFMPTKEDGNILAKQDVGENDMYIKEHTVQSLTSNATQVYWNIPSEFPLCPKMITEKPLEEYALSLKKGKVFCLNNVYSSTVCDYALTDNGNALLVMTHNEGQKPWALAKVTYKDGMYVHYNQGAYFKEDGARKYFTLAQGLEWTGGEVFDDFC